MVSVDTNINKQKYPIETKKIRSKTEIIGPTFAQNFTLPKFNEDTLIDESSNRFNTELLKALNVIAPIKSIKFTNRPKHSWFNNFIREQRKVVKIVKEVGKSTNNNTNGKHTQRSGLSTACY